MALTTTSSFVLRDSIPVIAASRLSSARQRRIAPEAGHALEILGHAIEYLADEFVYHGQSQTHDGYLAAIHILMEANRQVYFECPEIPTFGERCTAMLKRLWN